MSRDDRPPPVRSIRGPLISVIIPVLEAAETLERALTSILDQSYPHREILVIDGGSCDGTVEILERYDESLDLWLSEPDRGLYDAMNKGIDRATGDWLHFMGADDVLVDILDRIGPRLVHPRTIYYGDVYMTAKNRVYDGPFPWHKLRFKNVCHQAVFYPRAVFERYRYELQYPICADYDLNMKLWASSEFKTRYLAELISIFGAGRSSSSRDVAFLEMKDKLVEQAFGRRIRRRERYFELRRLVSGVLPQRLRRGLFR